MITDTSLFEKTLAIVGKDPALSLLACVFEVPASVHDKQPIYVGLVESIGRGIALARMPAILISHTMKPVTDVSRELIAAAQLHYVASGVHLGMRAIAKAIAWSCHSNRQAPNWSNAASSSCRERRNTCGYRRPRRIALYACVR